MADVGRSTQVFVYGTLKPGECNHPAYCFDAVRSEPATAPGRLHLPPHRGYPFAETPPEAVLARGCGDFLLDLQAERDHSSASPLPCPAVLQEERIEGCLLTFPDGAAALARLDELEEFVPGGGMYDRVLTIVSTAAGPAVAWMYVAPPQGPPQGSILIGAVWPPAEAK